MLFFGMFCTSQRAQRRKAELTLAKFGKSYQTAGPIGTKFGTHMQIHMGTDTRQTNCPSRHKGGTWGGGFRGSTIQTYGEAVRFAPTLVHVCGFVWEWT